MSFFFSNKWCSCQKPNPNPTKKCSKSHSRCKGILFCDKSCELNSHKKQKEEENAKKEPQEEESENVDDTLTKEMTEAAKAEKAKKKKAKKLANKEKTKGDGAFWWNNSVYASW